MLSKLVKKSETVEQVALIIKNLNWEVLFIVFFVITNTTQSSSQIDSLQRKNVQVNNCINNKHLGIFVRQQKNRH